MIQETYIAVKPHFANYPEVINYIKGVVSELGLEIKEEAFIQYTREDAQVHYAEHFRGSYDNAKPFYPELEDYITSDKAYGMIVVGEDAIARMRAAIKEIRTNVPAMLNEEARKTENVIHGSDCEESAENEKALFKIDITNKV